MTTENNKIIAKFMGVKQDLESGNYRLPHYSAKYVVNPLTQGRNYDEWADRYTDENYNTGYLLPLEYLQYNTSFDWLMEVVEKIESLGYRTLTENECFMITKSKLSSFDVRSKDDYNTIFSDNYEINHYGGSKKENVYNACVEFIKWYNENKD